MVTDEVLKWLLIVLLLSEATDCVAEIKRLTQYRERPRYQGRNEHAFFEINSEIIYDMDPEQFKVATHMTKQLFDQLFSLVKEKFTKHSNRRTISPKCRLFLTLAYLAYGGSKEIYSMAFKMGVKSVRRIIYETCDVLWDTLAPIYLAAPNTSDWNRIAANFEQTWKLPHCVGAIDGKYINITCPSNSGSQDSLILLGVCDADYTFTGIDIGAFGSQSDGGVLWHSDFGKKMFGDQLGLPMNGILPESQTSFPHYFVGDATFPLKPFLMRPYPGKHLAPDREHFNERLSRASRTIENTFGVLASRWKVLLAPLNMSPNSAEKVVKACVLLHNFVKMRDDSYIPRNYVDRFNGEELIPGLWRKQTLVPLQRPRRMWTNNASRNAFQLRDQLKEYLTTHPISYSKSRPDAEHEEVF